MFKSHTSVKLTIWYISLYLISFFIIWYLCGDITLKLIAISKTFLIDLFILGIYCIVLFLLLVNRDVFKVYWDDKRIIFKYLCCRKKKTYLWESISSIYYYRSKLGIVHLFIATDDGEFYSLPDVPHKLYQVLRKYTKAEIKTIRHPMEILPYLRERRKNARKSRKKLNKRR